MIELKNRLYMMQLRRKMGSMGTDCYIPYGSRVIGEKYISIGNRFYSYGNLRLEAFEYKQYGNKDNVIVIGNKVAVGNYCHIGAINRIEIGDNVLMGSNILITDHMHGNMTLLESQIPPNERSLYSKGPVIIEKNVFIGDGVKIMPGVTIGEGAIIGCNAVVTHNVERYAVMAGVPAVKIK